MEISSTAPQVGTSGWSYADWVGPFYPGGTQARDYLDFYARQFPVVEVDSTFYAVPDARTVQGWRDRTPGGFRFALKVPGLVTHGNAAERVDTARVLRDDTGKLDVFLERSAILGEKLATLLFQFPYFRVKELELQEFLARLAPALEKVPAGTRAAVEIRNKTWLTPNFLGFLSQRGAAAVLLDHPYMPLPKRQLELGMVTANFAYVRLIGDRHAIEKKTTQWGATVEDKSERIQEWAEVLRLLLAGRGVTDIYTFVNNHFAGHGPATVRELVSRLAAT